jgi:hypothetical protein
LFGFPAQAFAYIDPGVGSLLLQGIAAGLISLMVFWRNLRIKIMSFFAKKHDNAENVQAESDAEQKNGNEHA